MSDQPVSDNVFDTLALCTASPTLPLDHNPAAIYLASLSLGSRLTMHTALNTIGEILGIGAVQDAEGRDMRPRSPISCWWRCGACSKRHAA
jgi:hypothetical protein